MGRSLRPWWLALVVSLALHGALIVGLHGSLPSWTARDDSPVYDVELLPARAPAARVPIPAPVPPPQIRPAPAAAPPPAPIAEVPAADAAAPPSVSEAAPHAVGEAESSFVAAQPVPEPVVPPPAVETRDMPAVQAEPPPPPLNALPRRIDMRFKLSYGIASGEQTLVWVNESDTRYTVVSVAEATGLAGLFYRGRFVQTSRGRITPRGLQPEEFWDQRGDKRSSAQFDAARGQLTLNPAKGAPRHFDYAGDVQDALSLFFQLALTAPPASGELGYTVFNGKKLRDYRYEVRETTQLDTALGPLRTLHLARVADGDGRFEVWLAIDRYYLPVRIVRSDDRDTTIELSLLSMTP